MAATIIRSHGFVPRAFLEWGVAVPFTTPLLTRCRIRPGKRGRTELLVPNLSGSRGIYVFDLEAAPKVANLTLHDRLLLERLLEVSATTPSEIRKSALHVALDGAAGRRAAREAEAAIRVDAKVGLMIRLHLVTRLLDEAGLEGIDWRDFAGDNVELRSTIKHRLAGVAPGFGRSVDGVFQAIEEIADVATCVGCGAEDAPGRNQTMLARLRTFIHSHRQWSSGEPSATMSYRAIRDVVDRALTEATTAQGNARRLLDQAAQLLRAWYGPAGDRMRFALTRPEWLLDGWGQICGMWEAAARDERSAQREILQQIRAALPLLDPEDRVSGDMADAGEIRLDGNRQISAQEGWRTGMAVLDSRARAELLRAATI